MPAFSQNSSQIHVNGNADFNKVSSVHSIPEFIANFGNTILTDALLLVAVVAVLFLVFYGFQYITAGGDPEKAKKARSGIINAIIGIIVVALAFTIVHFAINTSGAANNLLDTGGASTNNTGNTNYGTTN